MTFPLGSTLTVALSHPPAGVAGAGLEWAFAENWSAKVEYKYLDFGEKSLHATVFDAGGDPAGLTEETKAALNFHTVEFGVNYRF